MAVAASGAISLAAEHLAWMLANCATFRTITGAATPTAALEHIYHQALPPPAGGAAKYTAAEQDSYRPFGLIGTEDYEFESIATGTTDDFSDGGTLKLALERTAVAGASDSDNDMEWLNIVGAIVAEMAALAGEAGYLKIVAGKLEGHARAHEKEVPTEGDYQVAVLTLKWSGAA